MKHRLWLMSGIPGAGKSTWIKNHLSYFNDDVRVISRDAIRFSIVSENEEYFAKEKLVYEEFVKQAKESLSKNIDTILDATHISEGSRSKILRSLGDSLKGVEVNIIMINTDSYTAIEQNELRKNTRAYVPRGVIRRMSYQITTPTIEEGFDNIFIYTKENNKPKYKIINRK